MTTAPTQSARPAGPASGPSKPVSGIAALDPVRVLRAYWIVIAVFGVLGVGLGVGAYIALLRYAPQYISEARFRVLPPLTGDLAESVNVTVRNEDELEIFMETQALIVRSPVVLGPAVEEPSIRSTSFYQLYANEAGVLDEEQAITRLGEIVMSNSIAGTQFFRVAVKWDNPSEAAVLARAVIAAYTEFTENQSDRDINERISNLQQQISQRNTQIRAIENQRETLLRNEDLSSTDLRLTDSWATIQAARPQLQLLQQELAQLRSTLESYDELRAGRGEIVFPEAVRELAEQAPNVQAIDREILFLRASLKGLRENGYGEQHPDIRRGEARSNALQQERAAAVQDSMAAIFESTVEGLRQSISELESQEAELLTSIQQSEARLADLQRVIERYNVLTEDRIRLVELRTQNEATLEQLEQIREIGDRVQQIQAPTVPTGIHFPKPIPVVFGITVLMGGLGAGLVFLKEIAETRVRMPQDISLIPNTRLLGYMPHISMDPARPKRPETVVCDAPHGSTAESIRELRSSLMQASSARGHKSILFVSGMPGSGTTTLISNLAISMQAAENKVCVVDANLRRPAMHSLYGLDAGPGFAELLTERASIDDVIQRPTLADGNAAPDFITAGSERSGVYERFTTDRVDRVFEELRNRYDFILIDCAPLVVGGDANALSGRVDASVAIVRAMSESRGLVARLRNRLVASRSEFMGVVVNCVRPSAGGYFRKNFEVASDYLSEKRRPAAPAPAVEPAS